MTTKTPTQRRRPQARTPRRLVQGDIAPRLTDRGIADFSVREAVSAAHESKAYAVGDILQQALRTDGVNAARDSLAAILKGASPDDVAQLRRVLLRHEDGDRAARREHDDAELAAGWRDGGYPYHNLLSRKTYERQKYRLQVELLKLQAWVKDTGARVVILFEGRDAAGKGGTIKRFMEHLNPRGARVVALEKPSEVERGQW